MKGLQIILCFVLATAWAKPQSNTRFGGFPGFNFQVPFPSRPFQAQTQAAPATCRRWCLTPENSAYCCETVFEAEGPVGTKPLNCPDVRPTCPHQTRFGRPETCSNDYKCHGFDKCCFDRCLGEHVCKPPSVFG